MASRAEAITVLPAIVLLVLSCYLAFLTFQFVDFSMQKTLITMALGLFLGGLVLAVCWSYYWGEGYQKDIVKVALPVILGFALLLVLKLYL